MGRNPPTCYPKNTLSAQDLLPSNENAQVQQFNNANPVGEGILKGVNLLEAGFHHGINTVGQSLRNPNLNLRAEPANPQVPVSPWMNTTIGPDLDRKSLENDVCNDQPVSNGNVPVGNDVVLIQTCIQLNINLYYLKLIIYNNYKWKILNLKQILIMFQIN